MGKTAPLRILATIAAQITWEIHQIDAVKEFLNSILNEEIYFEEPTGFSEVGKEIWVCKHHKSLYRLKQAPRHWKDEVIEYLVSLKSHQCELDPCTYVWSDSNNIDFCAIYVHVDEFSIMGNNLDTFKSHLNPEWEIEECGRADTGVGIRT